MYRRPKFLEILLDIRQEMAREADFDADLFAELVRHGSRDKITAAPQPGRKLNGSENSASGHPGNKNNSPPADSD